MTDMIKQMRAAITRMESYQERAQTANDPAYYRGYAQANADDAKVYALASIAESLAKIAEAVEAQKDANVNREPRAYYGVIK